MRIMSLLFFWLIFATEVKSEYMGSIFYYDWFESVYAIEK